MKMLRSFLSMLRQTPGPLYLSLPLQDIRFLHRNTMSEKIEKTIVYKINTRIAVPTVPIFGMENNISVAIA